MADMNCTACDDLRQEVPELITDGLDATMCTSLKNNTGLKTSSGNDDCTDLNNMNDCLVGNLETEVEKYELCDWKAFAKVFINNLWTVLKAMICAICGLWEHVGDMIPLNSESEDGLVEKGHGQVNKVWATDEDGNPAWRDSNNEALEKLQCIVDYLSNGTTFELTDAEDEDRAYIVAGKGVTFHQPGTISAASLSIKHIAGGMAIMSGSCRFYPNNDFNEPGTEAYPNFDDATSSLENNGYRVSNARKHHTVWGNPGRPAIGGELVYEVRIKKSYYPQIKEVFQGRGTEANSGAFTVHFHPFDEGSIAYGQHGWCYNATSANPGAPRETGYSWGHRVPAGWIYIQCRIHWIESMGNTDGLEYSPYGYLPMRLNMDEITC